MTQGVPLRAPKWPKMLMRQPYLAKPSFLLVKRGTALLNTKCLVFLVSPTPSPSWVGASLICHPRGPYQNPKATQHATKITRLGPPVFFVSDEGNSCQIQGRCNFFSTSLELQTSILPFKLAKLHPGNPSASTVTNDILAKKSVIITCYPEFWIKSLPGEGFWHFWGL